MLFIEVTNLHTYSRFYDITLSGRLFEKIYHRLLEVFSGEQIFLYGSDQIVVAQEFIRQSEEERQEEQHELCRKVIQKISSQKFSAGKGGQYYTAALTVGAASSGGIFGERDLSVIISLAHFAMLKGKERGEEITVADDKLRLIKKDLDDFNKEMEKGFKLDEFTPFFMPFFHPQTLKITGCESLVRWNKDKYRVIEAAKFKDIANEKNLFEKIDKRVMQKSFTALKSWKSKGFVEKGFKVAINLSKKTLIELDVKTLVGQLTSWGISPQEIEFDLDFESKNMQGVLSAAQNLKNAGFNVAYDTSGYLDISLLAELDFDTVKIGGLFATELSESRRMSFFREFIKISKNIGCHVLAKGVENKKALDLSKDLGVDFIEGYYFTKPLIGEGFEIFLNKYKNGVS